MSEPKATSGRASTGRASGRAPRSGRPRAADLEKLNQNILTAAGELFLQYGFDGTSMDAVAEKARISKRTLYARHADKSALFNSAVHDLLERHLIAIENKQYEPGDLPSVLLAIGRDMVASVLRPEFLAVHRLITFESQRRPDFGRWIDDETRRKAVRTIATILQRHADELRATDFERAAEQFMSLTVDVQMLRSGVMGLKATSRDTDDRLKAAIDLFLNGVRHRGTPEAGQGRGGRGSARRT